MGSCDDFLEEEPLSELGSEQFFSEPDHAYSAVNSLYRTGAPSLTDGGVYSGTPLMLGAYMSGFFTNEYAGQELHVSNTQQLTLNGDNIGGYLQDRWRELYLGISRANNAIKNIPETPDLSDAEKNQLMAEAKFFRAFAYYYLVRWFGPVPLTTEPYESLDNLYLERSPVADVYALIEADLTEALEQGNLPKVSMVDNGKRVTAGAVATLLADVYLTMSGNPLNADRYADAAAVAQDIINGEYGPYALVQHDESGGAVDLENSAYNKIRKSDASATEHIYIKEYDPEIGTAVYARYSYPVALASEVLYDITNGAYQPSDQFLSLYDPTNDLRAQERQFFHSTFLPTGQTFETTPFAWHDDTAIFETANSGKDFAVYGYADVLLIAAEAIARSSGVNADAVDYLAQVRSRGVLEHRPRHDQQRAIRFGYRCLCGGSVEGKTPRTGIRIQKLVRHRTHPTISRGRCARKHLFCERRGSHHRTGQTNRGETHVAALTRPRTPEKSEFGKRQQWLLTKLTAM